VTSDDDRTVAEELKERLNSISRIVEEHITDDGLAAKLRRLKDTAKDHPPREHIGVRGRRALLNDLLTLMRGSRHGPAVLAGPGGAGKTTVAAILAEHVRALGDQVWWISAADPVTLAQGLTAVARQLGGTLRDVEAITRGAADAADRFWRLLNRASPRWLLVFDEADDPRVLAAGNSPAGIQDLTGWVRSSARGLALVTSRETDPQMWRAGRLLPVVGLKESHAAQMLRELAPAAGDDGQARELARRLDGHPLSLRLAGRYLRLHTVGPATFAAYERELGPEAEPHPRDRSALASIAPVARALELSLDGLARRGIPHARPVLQLASCYAPKPIPAGLLGGDFLAGLPAADDDAPQLRRLDEALRGLREVGLIEDSPEGGIALHAVVAAASRASLDRPGPGSRWIRRTAIASLAAVADGLPFDRPDTWQTYQGLRPHLMSLLETTAKQVDQAYLSRLMETAARMVRAFFHSGASQAGRVLCERALAHGAALGNADLSVLRLRHFRAWAVADQGDLAEAEVLYRDVLHGRLPLLGPKHPDVLRSRHELAWIAACRGDWAEAEKGYRAVLHDSIGVLAPDDPEILITRHELGWAIANQGRLDEAQEVFQAVLADRVQVLGSEHQRTLATRHELAWITARQGKWAEAETDYRQLLDLRLHLFGGDHPDTLLTRHELAWIAARRGRMAEAQAGYADVLDHRRRVLGADHPETRATWEALEELRHGRIVDARHLA
jgi:tetratricopeptide (TPR) repeat protein